ncbi:hypothetical protein [Methylobacterium sp. Gmos1]
MSNQTGLSGIAGGSLHLMDYGGLLSLIPAAAAIASFIFSVVKFYVDYEGSIEKWTKKSSNKRFITIIVSIFLLSIATSYFFVIADKEKNLQKSSAIGSNQGKSTAIVLESSIQDRSSGDQATDTNENVANAKTCGSGINNVNFYDTVDNCVSIFACSASVHLCAGLARSTGRDMATDAICPVRLGRSLSLDKRRDISDRLLLRGCYFESYSWLAGLPGPEADNARGAWRARVCPEAPAVFSDRRFAQLGPITDGTCSR